MRLAGHVTAVTREVLGDELAAAAAAGTVALVVEDVADFDEFGGRLLLGGVVYDYTSVDDDTATIALAAPLPVAAAEGDRVDVWDAAAGTVAVEYLAEVTEDGVVDDDPIIATVDHALADRLALATREGRGESVELVGNDDGEWVVSRVLGKRPQIGDEYLVAPLALAHKATDEPSWPHSTWQTVTGWTITEVHDLVNEGSGWWRVHSDGLYEVIATAAFEANSAGGRGVRVLYEMSVGGSVYGTVVTVPGDLSIYGVAQSVQWKRLTAGDRLSVEARQTSGAGLTLIGNPDGSRTSLSIRRVG